MANGVSDADAEPVRATASGSSKGKGGLVSRMIADLESSGVKKEVHANGVLPNGAARTVAEAKSGAAARASKTATPAEAAAAAAPVLVQANGQ